MAGGKAGLGRELRGCAGRTVKLCDKLGLGYVSRDYVGELGLCQNMSREGDGGLRAKLGHSATTA